MGAGHNHDISFDGADAGYRRRLWAVIAINAGMFVVEVVSGRIAGSQALFADSLDFFGDAMTYGLSLAVIGQALALRSKVAMLKGVSLLLMGLWVAGSTLWRVYAGGVPDAPVMGAIGFLALLANVASVLILMSYKDGDANVRSVWLCSRNDAIGNVAVVLAAAGVWGTATGWPDLAVAGLMSGLFLWSSFQIIAQARAEMRGEGHEHDHEHGHDHDHGHDHSHAHR